VCVCARAYVCTCMYVYVCVLCVCVCVRAGVRVYYVPAATLRVHVVEGVDMGYRIPSLLPFESGRGGRGVCIRVPACMCECVYMIVYTHYS